jgi:chromosome segregation ATPase
MKTESKKNKKVAPKKESHTEEIKRYIGAISEHFQSGVDTIVEQFSGFKKTLDSHTEMIGHILEDVTVLKEDMKEVKSDVKVLQKDMKEVKSDVKVLQKDMKEVKGDIKVLQKDMKEVKGELKGLQGEMKEVKSELKNTNERLGSIEQEIREIKNEIKEVKKILTNKADIERVERLEMRLYSLEERLKATV